MSYIDAKIDEKLSKSENGSSKSREELHKLDEKIAAFALTPENEAKLRKAVLRMGVLKKNQCPIPDNIKKEFFAFSVLEEGARNKNCPADLFLEESKKELSKISKFPDVYEVLESQIYNELRKNISNSEQFKLFEEKWKKPDYRKSLILIELQIEERKKNGCKDVSLPIRSFIMEFLDK